MASSSLREKALDVLKGSECKKVYMLTKTTVVVARLPNGYEVTGTSAPVDPADFDEQAGEEAAMQEVISKVEDLLAAEAHDPLTPNQ